MLGVDQLSDDTTDKPVVARAVTLEVTPDQADILSLAKTVGTVSFTLRHVADDTPLQHHAATVADLALKDRPAPVRRVAAAPRRPKEVPVEPSDQVQVRVTRGVDTAGYSVSKL